MRQVVVKLHPDKSGRILIHWFIRGDQGPIFTPAGGVLTAMGPIGLGGARGRIACQPKRENAGPEMVNGQHHLFPHSDDIRAVTCDACRATPEGKHMLLDLAERLDPNNPDLEVKRMGLEPKGD